MKNFANGLPWLENTVRVPLDLSPADGEVDPFIWDELIKESLYKNNLSGDRTRSRKRPSVNRKRTRKSHSTVLY